jgi:hypothetical protein
MVEVLLVVAILAAVANLAVTGPFAEALRREAPEVFASFLADNAHGYSGRMRARLRYWRLILLREYRSRLASCPRSRAWASWLFLVHWVQLVTAVVFVAAASQN